MVQCLQLARNVTMKIDSAHITRVRMYVRKTESTMYKSLSDAREAGKCTLSVLTGVRIKRTNLSETTSFSSEQTKQSVISGYPY